ncbi:hypothetical protein [Halobacteriovorax sp. YZS-1-1]|uniref:hypothetical protein n=1 Tax=unclassified Halobacteriovorax TaxID=2639665 RepID=UPI00399A7F15
MASNNKYESKHLYLQSLIAEILRDRTEGNALTISEIHSKLEDNYDYFCARKTVARNIHGMSDNFKLLSIGERPVRYWIDSFFEPDVTISLQPKDLQLITYALRNLRDSSNSPLSKAFTEAETALLTALPKQIKDDLKYAVKSYKMTGKGRNIKVWPKNNIEKIFVAIRKKYWIRAKVKNKMFNDQERDIHRKLAIKHIWFSDGIPFIEVYDQLTDSLIVISATELNSIELSFNKIDRSIFS